MNIKNTEDSDPQPEGELNAKSSIWGSATQDPHHLDRKPGVNVFDVYGVKPKEEIVKEIRDFASSYNGKWSWPYGQNCHSFQKKLLKKTGLTIEKVTK